MSNAMSPSRARWPTPSDEARLMFRPFVGYAELASRPPASILERWIVLVVAIGAFVSFTAAGRLVLLHVVDPALFWAHFVILPCAVVAMIARVLAPNVRTRDAISLYLAGSGPWLVFLCLACALCLFAEDPGATFRAWLARGIPPIALFVTLGWGALLTFAFFRAGLSPSRRRAFAATASFYVVLLAVVLSWFLFTGQLLPIFR
jgi:hypothetical protein